jgi:hypothetical protein
MLAIAPERYEALRTDPRAVRGALNHLAGMSFFKQNASEAKVLTEIRASRHLEMVKDVDMRRRMAEPYARDDALVDAALARGNRERPLAIGTNWRFLNEVLVGGVEQADPAACFGGLLRRAARDLHRLGNRRLSVADLGHDLPTRLRFQNRAQAVAEDLLVDGNENARAGSLGVRVRVDRSGRARRSGASRMTRSPARVPERL